jgi:sensor histidine kinase regulating citrate/malate metabolism
MIDALLSIKREIAERENIQCDWNIVIPPKLPIKELDACAVLGNALDNAIEACLKSTAGQPFIKLEMHIESKWLLCSITNPIGQIPKIEKGTFLTSKPNTEQHGFGVQNMKQCCEDMGGNLEIFHDTEKFTVRFMLPLDVVWA